LELKLSKATELLREKARKLLSDGTVQVVIGYEKGPNGKAIPAFVTKPEECGRLIFEETCYANLARYLLKPEVKELGKPAIVLKGCDGRAVNVLIKEARLKREDLYAIGVECPGLDKVACRWCEEHTPTGCDDLIPSDSPIPKAEPMTDPMQGKSADEKWEYWMGEFSRCIKCYACRQACPICHCTRCIAEKNLPQWIDTSPHARGNVKWNLIRAFHLAGRCVECGECQRACPMNLPLMELSISMRQTLRDKFASKPGMDAETPSALASFKENDEEDFFL